MRLDKFLKVSRLIKRRSVAADACDSARVELNGRVAKPGRELKIGDRLAVRYGDKTLLIEILSLNPSPKKDEADSMYRIIE